MATLSPWAWPVLILIAAAACTTAAMIGHEGVHKSFAASSGANWAMSFLAFPLFAGLGALYWKKKHDGNHHGHPNVEGEDPDIKLWPMTSSREAHLTAGPGRRWFQRHLQGYAFWPLTFMMPVLMRISSVQHLMALAREGRTGRLFWIEAACLFTHYVVWLVVPSLVFGFLPVFIAYWFIWGMVGIMLAMIFAPAHMGLPVITNGGQHNDWVHQLETTRNLELPRWLSWFFIGLDYQVEHHLFPKIPHQEMPRAAAVVRAWCAEHRLPYQTIKYGPALIDVTRFINRAWDLPTVSAESVRAATLAARGPVPEVTAPPDHVDVAGLALLASASGGATAAAAPSA